VILVIRHRQVLIAIFGHETRGRDLRELEAGDAVAGIAQDSLGAE